MAKPYSMDLRERVVAAVAVDGMSCHAAAARFGGAASSAIKWVRRVRETGSAAPGQMGGHRLGILSGAHRDWLLERTGRDFTLRGLVVAEALEGYASGSFQTQAEGGHQRRFPAPQLRRLWRLRRAV